MIKTVSFNRTKEEDKIFVELRDSWWAAHRWVVIPEAFFTDFGFCTFIDNKPIVISFLYPFLGSKSCCWGYQITNPDSSDEERGIAINDQATSVSEFAKKLGFELMLAYPDNKAIRKRLIASGFVLGNQVATQVIKELKDG